MLSLGSFSTEFDRTRKRSPIMKVVRRLLGEIIRGRLSVLMNVEKAGGALYSVSFISALLSTGLLGERAARPMTFEEIDKRLECRVEMKEALRAWLQVGLALRVLSQNGGRYALRSRFARRLAETKNDPAAAMIEELPAFDHRLVLETPKRVRTGRKFSLDEQPAALVARSSRQLDPS